MNKISTGTVSSTEIDGAGKSGDDTNSLSDTSQPEPDSLGSSKNNSTSQNNANWFARFFSKRSNGNNNFRETLSKALTLSSPHSKDFAVGERTMLRNILLLQDVRVEDIMIPRVEIDAVDINTPLGELLVLFENSDHSRMPVYGETLDDPRGMVHIRDLLAHLTTNSTTKRKSKSKFLPDLDKVDLSKELGKLNIVRKVLFVPPSMLAADLMTRMQATRTQIALVIDEYGGTDGLISLEDIVEVIVGDIEDEHDDDEILIVDLKNGRLKCDAKAEIDDIKEALGGKFDVGEHADDADTIGGVIFSLLGRVPVKGEMVVAFGYEFNIIDADPRRVKSVDMRPVKRTPNRK